VVTGEGHPLLAHRERDTLTMDLRIAVRSFAVCLAATVAGLLGHPIRFDVEDDQCNAEGGQTAATKLAANPQMLWP
jgi:hypothetical protein